MRHNAAKHSTCFLCFLWTLSPYFFFNVCVIHWSFLYCFPHIPFLSSLLFMPVVFVFQLYMFLYVRTPIMEALHAELMTMLQSPVIHTTMCSMAAVLCWYPGDQRECSFSFSDARHDLIWKKPYLYIHFIASKGQVVWIIVWVLCYFLLHVKLCIWWFMGVGCSSSDILLLQYQLLLCETLSIHPCIDLYTITSSFNGPHLHHCVRLQLSG